jgi:hypothetical protein
MHFPSWQSFEQQASFEEQALPAVLQLGFSAAQRPSTQLCPQHSASHEHGIPSEKHCVPPQVPPVQFIVQQSVGEPQLRPSGWQ